MTATNKSTSAYLYTVLNISDSDLMFSPNHMCLLSVSMVNAMTLLLTYFKIRIMPEKLYLISDYAGCSVGQTTLAHIISIVIIFILNIYYIIKYLIIP